MKFNKYGNKKVVINNINFHSKKEAYRYQELLFLAKIGKIEIDENFLQPKFKIEINGFHICYYIADFRYLDIEKSIWIVEDVKGFKTPLYKIKAKMFKAIYTKYLFLES